MIFFIILGVLALWLIVSYNLLVRDKVRVMTSWSDIDVQLKRRHDLIPKLVDVVKQYAAYESATLTAVTELRRQSEKTDAISEKGQLESQLQDKLRSLVILAEDYPQLQADQSFLDLQYNLTEVEKNLQYARRYYNGCVRNLNVRIASFPDLFVAKLFNFKPAEFFEFNED